MCVELLLPSLTPKGMDAPASDKGLMQLAAGSLAWLHGLLWIRFVIMARVIFFSAAHHEYISGSKLDSIMVFERRNYLWYKILS